MDLKDTLFSVKQTINYGGSIIDLKVPLVMGILNITPDSFYDGGYYIGEREITDRLTDMITAGAAIIDVGGYSSRPGAEEIEISEEIRRIKIALEVIKKYFPKILLSVDTFRAGVVEFVADEVGTCIINDISAGLLDDKMFETVARLKMPYIMMHMKGNPGNMQRNPVYDDVTKELISFFTDRIDKARNAGILDIMIDPGFGFGKTLKDNYKLLHELKVFEILGFPMVVGLSRKSMIYKPIEADPARALNGTTALNTIALLNGASVLRVHDVKEASEVIKLVQLYLNHGD